MSVYETHGTNSSHPYFSAVRQWWPVVLAVALIGALIGWGVSLAATPTYESTAKLYFSLSAGDTGNDLNQGSTYTQSQMLSFAELAQSDVVLAPVVEALGLETSARGLASAIEVTTPQNTVVLQVTASSASPALAADIANETARSLKRAVADVAPRSSDTNGTTVSVRAIQPAVPATEPSAPNTKVNVLAGFLIGLIIAILAIVFRERFDPRVRSAATVRSLTPIPVLGSIGRDKSTGATPALLRNPRSETAEAYRQLRTSVAYSMNDVAPLCLVITSSIDLEGKSTVASNLALAFGEVGKRVVLVDAELRRPTIARSAGIADEPGLSTILTGTRRPLGSVRKAGLGTVDVITSGALPTNPTALLSRPSVATLITQLRHDYDVIIIDTPSAGNTTDAAILASHADGVVVVAARRRVRAPQFTGALEALERAGATVVGIVLNDTKRRWVGGSSEADDYRPNTTSAESAPSETVTTSDDESLEPTLNK